MGLFDYTPPCNDPFFNRIHTEMEGCGMYMGNTQNFFTPNFCPPPPPPPNDPCWTAGFNRCGAWQPEEKSENPFSDVEIVSVQELEEE